jgi:asparagine synthase (glutamine-hydrolysing)
MNEILVHRGPDGEGSYFNADNYLGLGHRRLAIIDIDKGQQPMCGSDGATWITFNGEIYNYRDLREELIKKGYRFTTNSDTEVLLTAYRAYGIDFLRLLNGIFAFALWDCTRKTLYLVRDHLGVKPVYFLDTGTTFLFASELKALLLYPEYSKQIDLESVDLHLTFRHTPSPKTLFKSIAKLPSASYLHIDHDGVSKIFTYWDETQKIEASRSVHEWLPLLNTALEQSVVRQMISDVPISLSLSGGIDSNLLLAIMSEYSKQPVQCFNIGFEGNEKYDETNLAIESARHFSAACSHKIMNFHDYEDMFNRYMWHLEEPLGNEPALAYYFVARLARDLKIKVLLTGQGADELYGGYHRYLGERYRSWMSVLPGAIAKFMSRHVKNERVQRALYCLNEKSEQKRFFYTYSVFFPEEKRGLYKDAVLKNIGADNGMRYISSFLPRFSNHNSLDKMLYIDTRFSLPDNLLLAEDKMAMAAGVEARVPYLDLEYVRLAESVPSDLKIQAWQFKSIHKRAAAHWLPNDFIDRKKIGFTNPMSAWLTSHLEKYFKSLINDTQSFTNLFLNRSYVENMFNNHKTGHRDYKRKLFLILSIEQWFKTFFNN